MLMQQRGIILATSTDTRLVVGIHFELHRTGVALGHSRRLALGRLSSSSGLRISKAAVLVPTSGHGFLFSLETFLFLIELGYLGLQP